MKNSIAVFSAILLSISAIAQKAPLKFGDVSLEALTMTSYAADTSASAVILADYGESAINYNQSTGFSLLFERTVRLKILKTDGFDWADFSIPLYHDGADDEKISGLKAVTYNLEKGKIVESKLKAESKFNEAYNENIDLVKITLPNVRVGSVLEITYKVNSDFFFNFQDWEFQYTIPVLWSEYRAIIPEFFSYDKYMQGYIQLSAADQS